VGGGGGGGRGGRGARRGGLFRVCPVMVVAGSVLAATGC